MSLQQALWLHYGSMFTSGLRTTVKNSLYYKNHDVAIRLLIGRLLVIMKGLQGQSNGV